MTKDSLRKLKESLFGFASIKRSESFRKIKGEIRWTLTDTSTGVSESGKLKNVVTLDASILIARLLKGTSAPIAHQSEPSFGIYALAVGTGDVGWNLSFPPVATNVQRSLYNEIGRKTFASVEFIDGSGNPSAIPTNVLDYTTVFSESEAVGPLMEMALLGGDISTNMSVRNPVLPPNGPYDPTIDLVGKDTCCNYLTFPVIHKPNGSTLSWTWRLTI